MIEDYNNINKSRYEDQLAFIVGIGMRDEHRKYENKGEGAPPFTQQTAQSKWFFLFFFFVENIKGRERRVHLGGNPPPSH